MTDLQKKGWAYQDTDGRVIYRASSLGACQRSLVAARLGESAFPPGAFVREAMRASSEAEPDALALYTHTTGHDVTDEQLRVEKGVMVEYPDEDRAVEVLIRGHIDGYDAQAGCVLEVKSLSGRNFAAYDTEGWDASNFKSLRRKYIWQPSIYAHALGCQLIYVVYNKHAESEEDLIRISDPMDPPIALHEIEAKVRFIEHCAWSDDLPPCDADCRENDAYGEVHEFDSATPAPEYEADMARYKEIQNLLGSKDKGTGLLGEMEDIKERIKESLGPGKHTAGRYTANVIMKKGTERVDTRRLKKERPDIAEEFTTFGPPTMSLQITESKGQGGSDIASN